MLRSMTKQSYNLYENKVHICDYLSINLNIHTQTKGRVNPGNMTLSNNKPCLHTCHNKLMCAHECCKNGVSSKRRNTANQPTPKPASTKQVASHLQELKHRAATLPSTPSVNKRIRLEVFTRLFNHYLPGMENDQHLPPVLSQTIVYICAV
jgi:hypothetical protein